MYCERCETKLDDDALFCDCCGIKIEGRKQEDYSEELEDLNISYFLLKKYIVNTTIVLLGIGLIVIIYYLV